MLLTRRASKKGTAFNRQTFCVILRLLILLSLQLQASTNEYQILELSNFAYVLCIFLHNLFLHAFVYIFMMSCIFKLGYVTAFNHAYNNK